MTLCGLTTSYSNTLISRVIFVTSRKVFVVYRQSLHKAIWSLMKSRHGQTRVHELFDLAQLKSRGSDWKRQRFPLCAGNTSWSTESSQVSHSIPYLQWENKQMEEKKMCHIYICVFIRRSLANKWAKQKGFSDRTWQEFESCWGVGRRRVHRSDPRPSTPGYRRHQALPAQPGVRWAAASSKSSRTNPDSTACIQAGKPFTFYTF